MGPREIRGRTFGASVPLVGREMEPWEAWGRAMSTAMEATGVEEWDRMHAYQEGCGPWRGGGKEACLGNPWLDKHREGSQ